MTTDPTFYILRMLYVNKIKTPDFSVTELVYKSEEKKPITFQLL